MNRIKLYTILLLIITITVGMGVRVACAENIDPDNDNSQYAYAGNVGWLNFEPGGNGGNGANVTDSTVTGYVWGENIGWINLSPVSYGGVVNDGAGNLSGYAWGENVGWINFKPTYGGVIIDANGNFSGYAWGENIGWIHFQNNSTPYKVKTIWKPTANSAPVAQFTISPNPAAPGQVVVFDGSASYSTIGSIVTYSWDFGDGTVVNSSTPVLYHNYIFFGNFTVKFTVYDNSVPALASSVKTLTMQVNQGNQPPVAVTGTYQKIKVGGTIYFDGSGSFDPNAANGDYIVSYNWDVNGDGVYDLSGVRPSYTYTASGVYTVKLKVTDTFGSTSIGATTVTVTVNTPPVANAGADQLVNVGSTVTLNGSGSSDPDADTITYSWTFTSKPTGSTATLTGATTSSPAFVADKAGTYAVSLTVSDGTLNNTDTVNVTTINRAPVANAGADQSVNVGSTVTLDGSASSDPDGDTITYNWSLTSKPTGSTATLSGSTSASPTFTADKAGTYVVSLVVNDGTVDSAADTVTITTLNSAPVANAGTDQTPYVNDTVTLNGSGSSDVDGDPLTYNWAFTSRPVNSTATLSGSTSASPTFTADKAGTYVVSLVVNDGTVDSAADSVTITTLNSAPVASAGTDQTPHVNDTVTLNGSGSSDVDGDPLTYNWAFTSRPVNSTATLSGSTSASPTFTADKAGTYVVSLVVNDGTVDSAADSVTITTLNSAPVASAGTDQTPYVNDTVTLNGSGSTDVDGDLLTFSWTIVTRPAGSNAALNDSTAVNPTFTVDKFGAYTISLTVNDGTMDSQADEVVISTLNSAPVANAGADQSAYVNGVVTLDGSGSTDVDGDLLTYNWAFTAVPADSTATLSNPTAVNPSFTVDEFGVYAVSLVVNDGAVDSHQADEVIISTLNSAPVANAGADQSAYVNNVVTLDGSGSSDVDGNLLTYKWAFTTKPVDSAATLSNATAVNPSFTVDKFGTYVVSLFVNDGTVDSQPDTVVISTLNSAPVANAGADQSAYVNDVVTLDGSGSTDVDGNALTYNWAFTTMPMDSSATLSNVTAVNPSFTVDKFGTYVVSLTVNDGTVNSQPDTVVISTLNSAPVANAGADQSAYVNYVVTLDGSGSSDADGNALTYNWAFTTKPDGSTATLSGTTTVNPTFTVDKAGTYVVSLIVNDGTVNGNPDTVTISTLNSAPVANAGADQSVYVNDTVTLDGSGSSDVDGNLLTYSWAFTTKPQYSNAALSDQTAVNPTFTVDKAGTYVVSLTVNDGTVNSTPDTVTISTLNTTPVANAGADQSVYVGNMVTLDGSGSSDADGNTLTYSWAFTSKPSGSTATLSNATAVNPTFTVDKAGTYVVSLTVNDGTVNSSPDTVNISTVNVAPVANAGTDQSVHLGNTVTLDGSGSSDADGNALTYSWAFTSKPSDSHATLNSPTSVNPTFIPDEDGIYVIRLIVNDGTVNSAPDTVIITAEEDEDIKAEVDIQPETINLKSKGKFMAFIDLPTPYKEADIVRETVECMGAKAIDGKVDGHGRYIATFNVQDLKVHASSKKEKTMEFKVTGKLKNGAKFEGSDEVKVKSDDKDK